MINDSDSVMQTGETSFRIHLGDTVSVETLENITEMKKTLLEIFYHEIQEIVTCYTTLTVYFNKEDKRHLRDLTLFVEKWYGEEHALSKAENRRVTIPVCYEKPFCLDWERIEEFTGLQFNEVIRLHADRIYTTYMIGFLPGFPYLGELNERLAVDRLDQPRLKVPQGSVGIGGKQTGVYPIESPGGWNILGKTPLNLFSIDRSDPFLIQPGDEIKFQSISLEDYYVIEKKVENNLDTVWEYIKEFSK